MKIKRFTILIITLLFFIVCSTLYINFKVVNTIRFTTEINDNSINELHEYQFKLDGSIQQLSFSNTYDSIGIIKDNAQDNILFIQNQALRLKNSLGDLNSENFNRYNTEIQEILNKLLNLQIQLDNLYFNLNESSKEANDEINLNYNEVEQIVNDISFSYNNLSVRVKNEVNLMFNALIFILVFTLGVLSIILIRFTYFLIPALEKKIINSSKDIVQNKHSVYFEEEKNIEETINQQLSDHKFSNEMIKTLIGQIDIKVVLDKLFLFISETLEIDRIGIAYIDYKNETIIQIYGQNRVNDLKLKIGFELPFFRTSLYDLIESNKIVINQDLEEQFTHRPKSSSLYYLLQEGIKSNLIYPLFRENSVYGFMFLSSNQKNFFNELHIKRTKQIYEQIQEILYEDYRQKYSK